MSCAYEPFPVHFASFDVDEEKGTRSKSESHQSKENKASNEHTKRMGNHPKGNLWSVVFCIFFLFYLPFFLYYCVFVFFLVLFASAGVQIAKAF
jgi:hypothetical protein